jgi:hypothetical protein
VFLLLNNMLLRTPGIPGAARVVWLDDGKPLQGPTYPDYVDYRDRSAAFADLAAYGETEIAARLENGEQPVSLRAVLATGNYFSVLQAHAALGRRFGSAEDLPPLGTASVVLSDATWARRFNRDPGVLGRTIETNFKPFASVGVMPRGFSGARAANGNPYVPHVWIPLWCHPLLETGDRRLVQRTTWWGMQAMDTILKDLRHTLRMCWKAPGIAAAAVATLALGIGVNIAVVTVFHAALLQSLPVEKPDRLVTVYTWTATGGDHSDFSYPLYVDLRDGSEVFSGMTAYTVGAIGVSANGAAIASSRNSSRPITSTCSVCHPRWERPLRGATS